MSLHQPLVWRICAERTNSLIDLSAAGLVSAPNLPPTARPGWEKAAELRGADKTQQIKV
jgi:hypothetical protein